MAMHRSTLVLMENTKQDTRNPILSTPRPGDPFLYELCPPEKSIKIQISEGGTPPLTVVRLYVGFAALWCAAGCSVDGHRVAEFWVG